MNLFKKTIHNLKHDFKTCFVLTNKSIKNLLTTSKQLRFEISIFWQTSLFIFLLIVLRCTWSRCGYSPVTVNHGVKNEDHHTSNVTNCGRNWHAIENEIRYKFGWKIFNCEKNVAWTQNLCSLYAFRNKTLYHKKVKVRNLKDLYKETKDRTKKFIKSLRNTV